jgi:hypothetical protein
MDKTSMLYWWPIVKDLGIPVPKTEIILISPEDAYAVLDGDFTGLNKVWPTVEEKGKEIGFPLFMRTDMSSSKWSWKDTCFIETEKGLKENIFQLIDHTSADTDEPTNAIVLREYIPMDSLFTAFRNMPVNHEFRYFIQGGKIVCSHWYWIAEAIRGNTDQEGWEQILRKAQSKHHEVLKDYALKVASVMPEFWSVDFCLAKDGRWVLIDMAEGWKSWHPKHCRFSKV